MTIAFEKKICVAYIVQLRLIVICLIIHFDIFDYLAFHNFIPIYAKLENR